MTKPTLTTRISAHRAPLMLAGIAAAANVAVLLREPVPWLSPVAGCVLLFGLPICLLYAKLNWQGADPSERLGYALVLTLLLLMGGGWAIDIVLPHLGVSKPLDHLPVLLATDALIVVLALWQRHRWPSLTTVHLPTLAGKDRIVLALCGGVVVASVAGAIRLNNGAGGGVTLAMLAAAATVLVLMIAWRNSLNPGVVTTAVYGLAVALLLMTSLRGWYITGHDIQLEYRVFELTKSNGVWSMRNFRNSYNACLSITILPTMVSRVTRIADPYVYKLIFQLIFAYCPVLMYKLARRYASMSVAILAVVFFVSFPAFVNDMPFLNRQEVAFLFIASAFLMMTNRNIAVSTRRCFIALCSVGAVVAHYSSTYVLIGMVTIAWVLESVVPLALPALNAARRRLRLGPLTIRSAGRVRVIGLVNILILVGFCLLWTGVYTRTVSGFVDTVSAVEQSVRGSTGLGSRAGAVSYGVFSLRAPSGPEVMNDYEKHAMADTQAGRAGGVQYPLSLLSQYATPLVSEKNIPLTFLGRALRTLGLNVSSFNSLVRQAAAKLYQALLVVGLFAALFSKRRRFAPGVELYALACGAAVIVAIQVVLPIVSINYGIERAFQQALIILSPFAAFGTICLFKWLGNRWSLVLSTALAVFLFLSLSGALPQLLGGYSPQLNLNNAGLYYDLYYVHPQEVTAMHWLTALGTSRPGDVSSQVVANPYTFTPPQVVLPASLGTDIWPYYLTKTSYVFLGFQTVLEDQAVVSFDGDLIIYRYPIGLLNREKDLIYSSNGVHIYR